MVLPVDSATALASGLFFVAASGATTILLRRRLQGRRAIFHAGGFDDSAILAQLIDPRYQTPLSSHSWPALQRAGPCFVSIAASLRDGLCLSDALGLQSELDPSVRGLLERCPRGLCDAMRVCALSYLERSGGRSKASTVQVPDCVLEGELTGKKYRPVVFLARGSAGAVFSAERVREGGDAAEAVALMTKQGSVRLRMMVDKQLKTQLVLKQVEKTQRDSAENEWKIAETLCEGGGQEHCVPYLDRTEGPNGCLWLLLRRVLRSEDGVDLEEYITGGFFQRAENRGAAVEIATQLVAGLRHCAERGVVLRDVKPDNVLVEVLDGAGERGAPRCNARFADFGLAVRVAALREGCAAERAAGGLDDADALCRDLVRWWYDTMKLVPKPKWVRRRPPEQCYQRAELALKYDSYMLGIILVSMACGIDLAHCDKPSVREDLAKIVPTVASNDAYLTDFEVGAHIECFEPHFLASFGPVFGRALFEASRQMLASDPRERPDLGDLERDLLAAAEA